MRSLRAPWPELLLAGLVAATSARAEPPWAPPLPAAGDSTLLAGGDLMGLTARKQQVDAELESTRAEHAGVRERLLRDGRVLYRLKRSGLLPIAGGMDAMLAHASRVGRLERIVLADLAAQKRLALRAEGLQGEQTGLAAQLSKSERDRAILDAARANAEQQNFSSAFTPRAAPPAPAPEPRSTSGYGLSFVGGNSDRDERFVEQRGHLALPVSGASRIEDATRAESDGAGLALTTDRGASVRAVAQGRVAFAERHGSYGEMVVLDHGDRYFSVYGGLSELEVQVGDELSKSARIGRAGSEPVYFEVRRGTRAQDARRWLGL